MEETWKDIEEFEGLYQISNLGNVKSLDYGRKGYAKNLTPKINNQGYAWVELKYKNINKYMLVHRLVAIAFIDNIDNLPIVNHKDENRLNNTVNNLEWCTNSYNVKYSIDRHIDEFRHLLQDKSKRIGIPYKRTNAINQYALDGTLIALWNNSLQIRLNMNANQTSILECCSGKRKTAYGFRWEFAN